MNLPPSVNRLPLFCKRKKSLKSIFRIHNRIISRIFSLLPLFKMIHSLQCGLDRKRSAFTYIQRKLDSLM